MRSPFPSLRFVCAFAALLSGLIASTQAQEAAKQAHLIPIERSGKVGDKIAWKITGGTTEGQKMRINGESAQEQKQSVTGSLDGLFETLAVSKKGKPTKYRISVEKLTLKENEEDERTVLQGGEELVAEEKGEESVFTVNGKSVDEPTAKLLEVLVDLTDAASESDADDDVAFGTDQPRKVGEEWTIRPAEILKSMPKDMPFDLDEKGITGTTKFLALKDHQGQPCAEVISTVTLTPKGLQGIPDEMKLTKNILKVEFRGILPLDKKLPPVSQTESFAMDFIGSVEGPNGSMTLTVSNTQSKEMIRK